MTKDNAIKLALEGAANYIDTLGGDSRKYRQALAEQPAYRAVKTYHEGKPVYVAEQPAQQEPATKNVVIANMGKPFTVKAYVTPQPPPSEQGAKNERA